MIKLIAHRGNFEGRNKEKENSEEHINTAIFYGYDVEIDVWKIGDDLFFGHDSPEHKVSIEYIRSIKEVAWYHAKNYDALEFLLSEKAHVFFHDQDEYTITSKGVIWAYSGKHVGKNAIAVMPEYTPGFKVPLDCYGVCTDDFSKIW